MTSKTTIIRIGVIVSLVLAVSVQFGVGQDRVSRRIAASISYISSGGVYINAGKGSGLARGDTVTIFHGSKPSALATVTAVSSSSSYALVLSQNVPPSVGDSVVVVKEIKVDKPRDPTDRELAPALVGPDRRLPESNVITGRLALQYGGAGVAGRSLDFSQPAAVMRLDVARLFGTGVTLSLHGRAYHELSDQAALYGQRPRTNVRMYQLSLTYDNPRWWYGYSLGRFISRYVGGLGVVDGGQLFVHLGGFRLGAVAGLQANYRNSSIDTDQAKVGAFLNYSWGGSVFTASNITVAYSQNLFKGKLDREFLYLQASLRLGPRLFLYQSTELDLHTVTNGVGEKGFRFTNTFLTVSYTPLPWLALNGGYDATRTIYLFESMKSIPDTLLDRSLRQGYRASVSVRLPMRVTLRATGNLRLASGSTPSAHTIGTSLRVNDILRSSFDVGIRYAAIRGLYTDGEDIAIDIATWISQSLTAMLRLDRYEYDVVGQEGRLVTLTASANVSYRVSRSLYCLVNVEQVWDTLQDARRVYLEVGIHF
ncbi:MAG: hypothetical protein WBG01_02750 [Bacteroidota bacterium]